MCPQIDTEYGRRLFKERKAYKIGRFNLAFVIEDMSKIDGGWSVSIVKMTYHGQYWRDYINIRIDTKQQAIAYINDHHEPY
jgi:hypothetical protein